MPLFNPTASFPSSLGISNFKLTFSTPQNMDTQPYMSPTERARQSGVAQVSSGLNKLSIATTEEQELERHIALVGKFAKSSATKSENNSRLEEVRNAPLFTRGVKSAIKTQVVDVGQSGIANMDIFPQYGLIGYREPPPTTSPSEAKFEADRDLIYANMNAPWSAFICGSQGAGKSHTFSCLLENALLSPNIGGTLPDPLTGIVFHYDKFTSHTSTQLCEAAFLCSIGIPVQVLVSPSNIHAMQSLYSNLPGLPKNAPRPQVRALKFHEDHLNVGNMKTLMAVDADAANPPLYIAVLDKILRDMARERAGRPGFNYADFKKRLYGAGFTEHQLGPLALRLQLLEEFLDQSKSASDYKNVFDKGKGTLTIVDLSCPFVDENDACALFSICLSLFLERRNAGGRIIALDEAHKFLTQSGEAENFTEQLISIIRQQRHLASRVVISTQEPTLSPQLLELCNVTFVHRFRSPRWLDALKNHIAGAANLKKAGEGSLEEMFKTIVSLRTGEALVFSPDSLLDIVNASIGIWETNVTIAPLLDRFIKVRIRTRISADGGRSIMASDKFEVLTPATGSEANSSVDLTEGTSEEEPAFSSRLMQPPRVTKQQETPQSNGSASHAHPAAQSSSPVPASKPAKGPAAKPEKGAKVAMITVEDIGKELKRQTTRALRDGAAHIDFGIIRHLVETGLKIELNTLSNGAWKEPSKDAIKEAALAWFKSHGQSRPAYAREW